MYNSSTYTHIHIHMYVHTHNVPHKHVSSHAQHTHKVELTLSGRSTYLWLSLDGKMLTPKVSRDCTGSGRTGDSLTSGRWATTFCTDPQYNSLRPFTGLTSQTFQGYSVIGRTSHPYCTICTSGTPSHTHTHARTHARTHAHTHTHSNTIQHYRQHQTKVDSPTTHITS